jgi:hypothetical protein
MSEEKPVPTLYELRARLVPRVEHAPRGAQLAAGRRREWRGPDAQVGWGEVKGPYVK